MFVGIITIDDAIDVLTDESTEDMQKMAAIPVSYTHLTGLTGHLSGDIINL